MKSRELIAKLCRAHETREPCGARPAPKLGRRIQLEGLPSRSWLPEEPPIPEEAAANTAIAAVAASLDTCNWSEQPAHTPLLRVSGLRARRHACGEHYADVYIENDLEARTQMTQKAAAWLTGRLKSLRESLEASERKLQEFRDRERIVDAKGVALGASRQLEDLTSSQVAARQKVAEFENAYNQVQAVLKGRSRATLDSIPAVLRNAAVARAKEQENEASRRMTELSGRYGAEHPRIIAATADLQTARENTRRAVDTVVASITREYEVAKATERTVTEALNRSKAEILDINRKEFQLASLEREVQTNRQLHDMFFSRFKETSAAGDLQSTIARVIDPAIAPSVPVRPQKPGSC
jgi:uncharacterized protein involved in exopolysaccharide biosynthesis